MSAPRGSSTGGGTASTAGPDAASTTGPDDSGMGPAPAPLAEAHADLARVDQLPVSERAQLLAAVNELLVAELAAMDEGGKAVLEQERILEHERVFALQRPRQDGPRPRQDRPRPRAGQYEV